MVTSYGLPVATALAATDTIVCNYDVAGTPISSQITSPNLRTSLLSPASGGVVVNPAAGNLLVGSGSDASSTYKGQFTGTFAGSAGGLYVLNNTSRAAGVGARLSLLGVSGIALFDVIGSWLDSGNTNSVGQLMVRSAGAATSMVHISGTGIRVQSGATTAASYLLHVAGTVDTTLLCASNSLDAIGIGAAPISTCKVYVYGPAFTYALAGQTSANTAVYGIATAGGIGVGGVTLLGKGVLAESTSTGLALHAKSSATTAQATVKVEQLDDDEPFIDYIGTEAADATKSLSSWTTGGSINGFIRISINGTDRWIPTYTAPTA